MGGLINLIKKLFSGIFSFVGGIFNSKKSGYYLELDDAASGKPAVVPAKAETPAPAQPAAVKAETTEPAKAKSTAPTPAKAEPVKAKSAAPVSAKAEPVKADPLNAESVQAPVNPEPVGATSAANSSNGSPNGAKPTAPANPLNLPQPSVNFASEYLVPKPTNTRRRPGANMGAYLDMAKQVKPSNN